jgi:hypothetical protein
MHECVTDLARSMGLVEDGKFGHVFDSVTSCLEWAVASRLDCSPQRPDLFGTLYRMTAARTWLPHCWLSQSPFVLLCHSITNIWSRVTAIELPTMRIAQETTAEWL